MIDEKEYNDLGSTIADLARKAEKKLEEVVDRREKTPSPPPKPKVEKPAQVKQETKVLDDAVLTLQEKIHQLEMVIEGLKKERAHLMGRTRALNAMLERSRRAK